ncbi:MAG TPA: class I SAM-dependent methyltransferase [Alphaproteobacteria bacterium]|nr:class I SAM-dependent methyltransferase [Alphaproteobacteria bacterium]
MTVHANLHASFDPARAEAFAGRLMTALNDAALVVMTSIGHRTGLFDAMAEMPPSTLDDIAARTELAKRYVREWLAVMVTGGVATYDPRAGTYRLPAEHAAFLTRTATPDNMAVTAQMIPSMGAVEDAVVERFRTGEGLSYDAYPRFHEVMAEDSGQTVVAALFDRILPLVSGLAERLEDGIDVLDVGCGAGRAMVRLAGHFPNSRFLGLDLSEQAVGMGRRAAEEEGLSNVRFEACDLSTRSTFGAYDLVTAFDAVHDQKDPQGLLDAVARSLKPGGVFLMQDIAGSSRLERNLDHPLAPLLYAVSCLHCTPVSLAQGGPGLGTMWGEELATDMLGRAGFSKVTAQRLPHDPFNVYFVARR